MLIAFEGVIASESSLEGNPTWIVRLVGISISTSSMGRTLLRIPHAVRPMPPGFNGLVGPVAFNGTEQDLIQDEIAVLPIWEQPAIPVNTYSLLKQNRTAVPAGWKPGGGN